MLVVIAHNEIEAKEKIKNIFKNKESLTVCSLEDLPKIVEQHKHPVTGKFDFQNGQASNVVALKNYSNQGSELNSGHVSSTAFSLDKTLNQQVEELEFALIQKAMNQTGNNQVRSAKILGITRGSLQYKLKKYGLIKEHHQDDEALKAA